MTKFAFNNWDKSMIRMGVDRERRRIRRALAIVVHNCRTLQYPLFSDAIDAATRAKKGKRK